MRSATSNLSILLAFAASAAASADLVLGTGSGFAIDGSSLHFSDIEIGPIYGTPLQNLHIEVQLFGLNHSRVGDLVVALRHVESGASTTLFANVGSPAEPFGSAASLGGAYAFTDAAMGFAGPTSNLWAAATAAGSGTVAPNFYCASSYGSDASISINAAFARVTSAGTWRLEIEDAYPAFDHGSIMKWAILLQGTPVPAPGAIALVGLSGIIGVSRRRS